MCQCGQLYACSGNCSCGCGHNGDSYVAWSLGYTHAQKEASKSLDEAYTALSKLLMIDDKEGTVMNMIEKRKLMHLVTTHLLESRGFKKSSDAEYDLEWDAKEPDSQFSLCYEDVEYMLRALDLFGYEIVEKSSTYTIPSQYEKISPTVSVSHGGNVTVK